MAFEWLVKLNDMVSDPAARVEKSIRRMTASFRDLATEQKKLQAADAYGKGDMNRMYTRLIEGEILQLKNQRDALKASSDASYGFEGRMKNLRTATRDWLQILDPLVRALSWVSNRIENSFSKIGQSIINYQKSQVGLNFAFGNKGGQVSDMVQALAARTGQPFGELAEQASKYGNLEGTKGDQSLVRAMLLTIQEAKTLGLEWGKLDRVFEATLSKPTTQVRELSMGLSGVVDETKLWQHMAEDVGKTLGRTVTVAQLNQMVKENRIGGSALLLATMETIQDMVKGGLGKATFQVADSTLEGSINKFEQRMEGMFGRLSKTKGFKIFKDALDSIFSVISSSKTEKLISDIANQLGSSLKFLTTPGGKKQVEDFFDGMINGMRKALPLITTLASSAKVLQEVFLPSVADKQYKKEASDILHPGEGFFKGGNRVSSEEFYGLPNGKEATSALLKQLADQSAAEQSSRTAAAIALAKSGGLRSIMDRHNIDVTIHVDARGAGEKDAKSVTDSVKQGVHDGLSDLLDTINLENGNGDIPLHE